MLAALLAAIGIYLLTDAIGQAFIERVYMSAEAQNQRNLGHGLVLSDLRAGVQPLLARHRNDLPLGNLAGRHLYFIV